MKTAVEWLVQELHDNGYFHEGVPEDIVKKAKEMEKEQMIEFFMKGQNTYPSEYVLDNKQIAEQYHNETFKSE